MSMNIFLELQGGKLIKNLTIVTNLLLKFSSPEFLLQDSQGCLWMITGLDTGVT